MRNGKARIWLVFIAVLWLVACQPEGGLRAGEAPKNAASRGKNAQTEIVGLVFRVSDGDTLTLRDARGREWRIRLHGIDSPERDQELGRQAGAELLRLVRNKNVRVVVMDKDKFGRLVGRVHLGELDVNREMVRLGYAWHYTAFAPDDSELAEAQAEAKRERRGIWGTANPLPPWEYRKRKAK